VAVTAESEENITNMLEKMNNTLKEYYTKKNQQKTKIIIICSKQQICSNIALDGLMLEIVQSFTYLGSKITRYRKSCSNTIIC